MPADATPDRLPVTERTRIKRLAKRAVFDRATVFAVLDAGFACHVGYVIDGQPYVTPTAYVRMGERVYWHGSSASRMLRQLAEGVPVCFTVSLFDGLVFARSGFNSSINYRSVMAFGQAELVEDEDERLAMLEAFTERLTPGRWAELRPPTRQELKATKILSLELTEVACKIRNGPPGDGEEEADYPIWAGVVPVRLATGAPQDDPHLRPGLTPPAYLADIVLG